MGSAIWVNKSGQTFPVYQGYDSSTGQPTTKIGDIFNREVYAYTGRYIEGTGSYIRFRGPTGAVQEGYIHNATTPANGGLGIHTYPYAQGQISGDSRWFYFFYMQRSETIYNPDGTVWGAAAQGALVAALDSGSGDSHPDWLRIYYVQHMPDRTWVAINPNEVFDYGFIPVGLEDGSMPSTISLYGSW